MNSVEPQDTLCTALPQHRTNHAQAYALFPFQPVQSVLVLSAGGRLSLHIPSPIGVKLKHGLRFESAGSRPLDSRIVVPAGNPSISTPTPPAGALCQNIQGAVSAPALIACCRISKVIKRQSLHMVHPTAPSQCAVAIGPDQPSLLTLGATRLSFMAAISIRCAEFTACGFHELAGQIAARS